MELHIALKDFSECLETSIPTSMYHHMKYISSYIDLRVHNFMFALFCSIKQNIDNHCVPENDPISL